MNIISHSYSHVITCFLFFFSTFRLSASALSRSSSAVHAGSCHAPSLSRAFALSRSSSAVHAGSCHAPSRSRAFALSRSNFAVPRRKLLCIFLLSGFRPINNKENPALSASSQSGFFLFLALLNAYGHYTTLEVFSDSCL